MVTLKIRCANTDDSEDIFAWRNDETTRLMSHSVEPVRWVDHCRWFEAALNDEHRHFFICSTSSNDEKVAVVRCDVEEEVAKISINLSPQMRGNGLAKASLKLAISFFLSKIDSVSQIDAEVKSNNIASSRTFEGIGFRFKKEQDGVRYYTFSATHQNRLT